MPKPPKDSRPSNVVEFAGVTCVVRPAAPRELSPEAAAEWRAVVEALPADWFNAGSVPLLTQYCRHVVTGRRVGQLIRALDLAEGGLDLTQYDKLLKMQERESRAISSLATRMRITQQATFSHRRTKPHRSAGPRPWEK